MNKNGALKGLGKVYGFSLEQLFKNKSNIVSFGIFIAVAIASVPLMCLFMDVGEGGLTMTSRVMTMTEFAERDEIGFDARYAVQYGYSILVMMVCVFSCTYIVRAIIEEKSSKLVETLMVSVKSEALILGKILSVMTFIFFMVAAVMVSFGASYLVTGMFMDTSVIGMKLEGMGITSELLNIGPGLLAVVIVSLLLAYMTFSLISSLNGAGCSSMEDMEAANMTAMMIILACYMITVVAGPAFGESSALIMSLCPFLSCFAAPANFIIGDIGAGVLIGSWTIQIICILLIHKLSSRVYDSLIMYKGKRLKTGRILAMAFGRKGVK